MAVPRRPDPPPLETDDVRVVAIGTALWGLAFVVLLAARDRLAAADASWWLATCAVGFGLGVVGVWYCRRRRTAIARGASRAGTAG